MNLVRESDPRREIGPALLHIQVRSPGSVAGDADIAGIQVKQTTPALPGDGFRKVHLPAQAVVRGQLARDSPLILSVEEESLLPLLRIRELRLRALIGGGVAQYKGSEAHTGRGRPGDW